MEKKNSLKLAGVFMDHAEARVLDLTNKAKQIIRSGIISHVREAGESGDGLRLGNYRSTNNEVHKHNREQNELHAYYNNLAEHLKTYDEILILGPTTAPSEFHNFCLKEKKLSHRKITTKKLNYLTENQIDDKIYSFFDMEKESGR